MQPELTARQFEALVHGHRAGITPAADAVVKAAVSMEHPQQAPGDNARMLMPDQSGAEGDAELNQQDQALARAGKSPAQLCAMWP